MRNLAERMWEVPLDAMWLLTQEAPPPRPLDPRLPARIYPHPHPDAAAVRVVSERLPDLLDTRMSCAVPVLSWRVVTTEYEVCEARAYGADGVLVSARAAELGTVLDTVSSLGMTPILRVADEQDARRAATTGVRLMRVEPTDSPVRRALADRIVLGSAGTAADVTLVPDDD